MAARSKHWASALTTRMFSLPAYILISAAIALSAGVCEVSSFAVTSEIARSSTFVLSSSRNGWIDPAAPVNTAESLRHTVRKALFDDAASGPGGQNVIQPKRLSLLGSTGSIGTQTLDIVDACPEYFTVDALAAGTNVDLMAQQVRKYSPQVVTMGTADAAQRLKEDLKANPPPVMPTITFGDEGLVEAATVATADTVVTGIVGAAGLLPTIEAIKLGKDIALANKETLISGGPVINPLVTKHRVNMVRLVELCIFFDRAS
jgi:1-deoxy-D-xylulose-5-phosphate reductoisomerase